MFKFSIDRGGTFTDVWSELPNGETRILKLLSEDPDNYEDAPREAIRRIIEQYNSGNNKELENTKPYNKNDKINAKQIEWIRMGTTVATNALLERQGEKTALAITKNFKDLLHIGNQSRPEIFDLQIQCPEVLYDEIIEIDERVVLKRNDCQLNNKLKIETGSTDESLEIWSEINSEKVKKQLRYCYETKGIKSLAVLLLHSYMYSKHEILIGELAKQVGFSQVSLSHLVMPMIRAVPRGLTTCVDAYLTPKIRNYIENFIGGFENIQDTTSVLFMQSDGGLTPTNKFSGSRAILSGPAGGVVGYALTTYNSETKQPVIGFDMGGTSTDVSRFSRYYEHVWETTTAGVTIQAPQLDIQTVAAGGGSRLFFRSGMFVVGPESSRAHPGPICYKKNGYLAVTDANLILGRLLPQYFPKIFGPNENECLDKQASIDAFKNITDLINNEMSTEMTVEEVAMGFIKIANETMCRPIRAITQAKGHDTSKHILACFGGAGGQHACAIARSLGIKKVFIHRYGGILSAYGLALADVVEEMQEPCSKCLSEENFNYVKERLEILKEECIKKLIDNKFSESNISVEYFLNLRYDRTDCSLMIANGNNKLENLLNFQNEFLIKYQKEFGFTVPDRTICIDDIRVRGVGNSHISSHNDITYSNFLKIEHSTVNGNIAKSIDVCRCYFDNSWYATNVYLMRTLLNGNLIHGPAIIIDDTNTIIIEPNCSASVMGNGNLLINIDKEKIEGTIKIGSELDSIQLSIFSHRFMSIAEQMGRVLQRTAISTNIKERLDFSCALFGENGGLVANAPHIPVHLGSMQEAVQYQIKQISSELRDGDVILSNHPKAGGSHLPDLTVITPVFHQDSNKPVFFVASRGHHADIGGSTPGSMPPHSKTIFEEGAVFKSFFLVRNGCFMEKEVTAELNKPAQYPGCSGTRNLQDNLSDLKAQVAANRKGIKLVLELIDEYSLKVVQAYMQHIQENAELAVRNMLMDIARKYSSSSELDNICELQAQDFMDCGAIIKLLVKINKTTGSAIADFSGTSPQIIGNLNTPRAVTLSALIYCLRCMVGYDVPLNQGCLLPLTTIIPTNSLLDPDETAAVVGGNVLTSQRIVDVIFKAFKVCAASQGCMNNVTFGDENIGYYETVAGGAGAGPGWNGRSGVHTHMTNTRITDPEILERRYPVILKRFDLRENSGGEGKFKGGDGIVRELLFRKKLTLSVLTERRVYAPYGILGGHDAEKGKNLFIKAHSNNVTELESQFSLNVEAGDVFRLLTPGGGGYGKVD